MLRLNGSQRARDLVHLVADLNYVDADVVLGRRRASPGVTFARAEAMFIVRERLGWSYERIGRLFGERHRQTVREYIMKYRRWMRGVSAEKILRAAGL